MRFAPVDCLLPVFGLHPDDEVDLRIRPRVRDRRGRSSRRCEANGLARVGLAGDLVVGGGEQRPDRAVGAQAELRADVVERLGRGGELIPRQVLAVLAAEHERDDPLELGGGQRHVAPVAPHLAERLERQARLVLDQEQLLIAQAALVDDGADAASASELERHAGRGLAAVEEQEHVGRVLLEQAVEREAGDEPAVEVAAHDLRDGRPRDVDLVGAEVRLDRGPDPLGDVPGAVGGGEQVLVGERVGPALGLTLLVGLQVAPEPVEVHPHLVHEVDDLHLARRARVLRPRRDDAPELVAVGVEAVAEDVLDLGAAQLQRLEDRHLPPAVEGPAVVRRIAEDAWGGHPRGIGTARVRLEVAGRGESPPVRAQ